MEMPRLSKSVKKVIRLDKDASGAVKPVVLYESPQGKEKKSATGIRLLDKSVRRSIEAQQAFLERYMSLHDRSNTKKRNGWVIDLAPNMMDAGQKFVKKLKIDEPPTT
ncbi:MAG TPA: hypothetical protein VNV86_10360 [Candidatus Acidoferrum sp.]|nr:hypothetical protein [Candidatus Acidoferrum sp.]